MTSVERCAAVDEYGMGRCLLDAHDGPSHAYEHVPGPPGPPQQWESIERVALAAEREALKGASGQASETWLPTDGSPGVAHLEFDEQGTARVTRECLAMLLSRAGFARVE